MDDRSASRLLSLPGTLLSDILWEVFQQSSFRDWLKLRQVSSTLSTEITRLLHTRNPLDDDDPTLALHIPQWRPVAAASMPDPQLTQYCARRALLPNQPHDPLDTYTLRVAAELMPVLRADASARSLPPPSLEDYLPRFYDYMIWPGRYTAHRAWAAHAMERHLPVSTVSCAALFGRHEYTIATLTRLKTADPEDFGARFDNVMLNAALGGHFQLIKELYALGVRPQRAFEPDTLACAAWCGSTEIFAYLLTLDEYANATTRDGADVPLLHRHEPPLRSAAFWAVRAGQQGILDLIFDVWPKRSAEVEHEHDDQRLPAQEAQREFTQDWQFLRGVLHLAVRWGHVEIARMALRKRDGQWADAAIEERDSSWMHSLLQTAAGRGHIGMVRLLLEEGVAVKPMRVFDEVMAQAARHGHVDVVKLLLDLGVGRDCFQAMSASPISWVQAAAGEGEVEVLTLLLERGFHAEKNGVQAAQIAAANGYVTVVRVLVEAGVDAERVLVAAREHGQQHVVAAIEGMRG